MIHYRKADYLDNRCYREVSLSIYSEPYSRLLFANKLNRMRIAIVLVTEIPLTTKFGNHHTKLRAVHPNLLIGDQRFGGHS